jgi:hypothetical protein
MLELPFIGYSVHLGTAEIFTKNVRAPIHLLLRTPWYCGLFVYKCYSSRSAVTVYTLVLRNVCPKMLELLFIFYSVHLGTAELLSKNVRAPIHLLQRTPWYCGLFVHKCYSSRSLVTLYTLVLRNVFQKVFELPFICYSVHLGTAECLSKNVRACIHLLLHTPWYVLRNGCPKMLELPFIGYSLDHNVK